MKLDTALCTYSGRPAWLNLLKTFKPKVEFENNRGIVKITEWMISKSIHPEVLSLRYYGTIGIRDIASDMTIFKLTQNSPKLKELSISSSGSTLMVHEQLVPYVAAFCNELEYLSVYNEDIPGNGIESLSITCHRLKKIALEIIGYNEIDKLLKNNKNISYVYLKLYTDKMVLGDMIYLLGLNCPLLQKCNIDSATDQVTEMQIETFTKGCPKLEKLHLEVPHLKQIHKLLRSLGSHNQALEELYISEVQDNVEANNTVLTREQSQSLQYLSNGCPLLKEAYFSSFKLSTSDISYLVNHSIHLEEVSFLRCNICDDGLIITKEADKLKYLKRLDLSDNPNITDQSIINLVKGCHNLKNIYIPNRSKLTDASLFSIAANCPNLDNIVLPFDKVNITIKGLKELLKKCPKLTGIKSFETIPKSITKELKRRLTLRRW